MKDIEIRKVIMDIMDETIGVSINTARYSDYPYPQRLARLCEENRTNVLRESGNIKKYLEIHRQIHELSPAHIPAIDKGLYEIISWLDTHIDAINSVTPEKNVMVISYLVFGQEHINKLLEYNFKSLLAYENIPCLAIEKQVIIYIQTTETGKVAIESSEQTKKIKAFGVHFDYTIIPDSVISLLSNKDLIYWMLGAGASLSIHYAKSLHATFHHSYPDIVYSNKFFSELLRLSKNHKAILGCGMRSDEVLMIPALSPYLNAESLSVPSSDLLAHHLNAIHQVAWPMMVNNRPAYWLFPESHVMIWESEDTVDFNSPHMMAHWLDYSVIKDLPDRFYQTLDSEMDLICKKEDYYIIQEFDQVYQAELSAPDRQALLDVYTDLRGAAQVVWNCVSYRDNVKFFFKEMRVKLNRDIRPLPHNHIPSNHVQVLQRNLYNTILSCDPYSAVILKRPRTHLGYLFQ